jgi:dTDP-4-amino-4,6-dideoxygalactose transaminase
MLEAVKHASRKIRFYEIDENLAIKSNQWIDEVNRGDLVICIEYFGFTTDPEIIVACQKKKAWVLQDSAQALLTETQYISDFVLFSPRKYLGVPDGGILKINGDTDFSTIKLNRPEASWQLGVLHAALLRREFDLGLENNRTWFSLFQKYDREAPVGAYSMSEISQTLLFKSFDYPSIAKKRRDNYQFLFDRLNDMALFSKELPNTVVPIGFPVIVENRDAIRAGLFEQQIYPPVHWELTESVPSDFKDSHRLSRQIMTIPCDQRYGLEEMQFIIDVFRKLISKKQVRYARD